MHYIDSHLIMFILGALFATVMIMANTDFWRLR